MKSTARRYPIEEFARRGDALYQECVAPQLTRRDAGKFVALDVESGAFEIAEDEQQAGKALRLRLPDAQVWMVRVGSRHLHRFGARRGT